MYYLYISIPDSIMNPSNPYSIINRVDPHPYCTSHAPKSGEDPEILGLPIISRVIVPVAMILPLSIANEPVPVEKFPFSVSVKLGV